MSVYLGPSRSQVSPCARGGGERKRRNQKESGGTGNGHASVSLVRLQVPRPTDRKQPGRNIAHNVDHRRKYPTDGLAEGRSVHPRRHPTKETAIFFHGEQLCRGEGRRGGNLGRKVVKGVRHALVVARAPVETTLGTRSGAVILFLVHRVVLQVVAPSLSGENDFFHQPVFPPLGVRRSPKLVQLPEGAMSLEATPDVKAGVLASPVPVVRGVHLSRDGQLCRLDQGALPGGEMCLQILLARVPLWLNQQLQADVILALASLMSRRGMGLRGRTALHTGCRRKETSISTRRLTCSSNSSRFVCRNDLGCRSRVALHALSSTFRSTRPGHGRTWKRAATSGPTRNGVMLQHGERHNKPRGEGYCWRRIRGW